MSQGKLVVIEGVDGTGKTTQHERLLSRLASEGMAHASVSFPRYERTAGKLISEYLSGGFGTNPGDVNAYAASSFYAVDRFTSFRQEPWGECYRMGGLVVLARYTTSNAIHQGAKLPQEEREGFFAWLEDYEYNKLGLPRPDLVFYLKAPIETALFHIAKRAEEENTPADIHERNLAYFTACAESGAAAASYFGWQEVEVTQNGRFLPIDEIHEKIYSALQERKLL
ncbi:MAG TPA: thymidylate kinase [Clostridiales bacterium]|jgi:dTMP kinase|nr:thymidylate kinase [Clostridiales bacterium]